MSLASLDASLFARKGEAAPTPFAGRTAAEEAFGARRRLVLVAPDAGAHSRPDTAGPSAEPARPRRPDGRLRFTFRLAPARHAELAEAADRAGLSRQRYLEEALEARLAQDRRRATP
jgi:hypothetical protein